MFLDSCANFSPSFANLFLFPNVDAMQQTPEQSNLSTLSCCVSRLVKSVDFSFMATGIFHSLNIGRSFELARMKVGISTFVNPSSSFLSFHSPFHGPYVSLYHFVWTAIAEEDSSQFV
ncbi:unnamed protein product [Protopolystoma xenopodis]|uniref:Uncharacterized protein n=1 Tax=Protopolystoma xenopodis TaxID=117903 RepID=A0A448X3P2_9PLAT|nr:unnamed protein product [Protopolystoma xenopodis]